MEIQIFRSFWNHKISIFSRHDKSVYYKCKVVQIRQKVYNLKSFDTIVRTNVWNKVSLVNIKVIKSLNKLFTKMTGPRH